MSYFLIVQKCGQVPILLLLYFDGGLQLSYPVVEVFDNLRYFIIGRQILHDLLPLRLL